MIEGSISLKLNSVKPHKISSHSAHSENCYFLFFCRLSDWVEMLWDFSKVYFKQMLKVSAFYLEKKSFIPKKKIFKPLSISKQKSFVYWSNFQWRFCSFLETSQPRTTDTQWRHKSKISEKLGRCGRQNKLPPYLKIWDCDWIFGRAVKAISSLGVCTCSPCQISSDFAWPTYGWPDNDYYGRSHIQF